MTDERLKRLAQQLIGMFRNVEHNNDVFNLLKKVAKKQAIYFSSFTPQEFLKFYFYILSLKKKGNFEFADFALENLFFASLFWKTGSQYVEECGDCYGEGRVDCSECDGSGNESCSECDGSGQVTCSDCDGEGEIEGDAGERVPCVICDGSGEVDCEECDGRGTVDCSYCDGDARLDCNNCDASGELEGTDSSIELIFICSWDKNLKNLCELNVGRPEPVGAREKIENNPNIITLNYREWGDLNIEFLEEIEEGFVYCNEFDEEKQILLSPQFEIRYYGFDSSPKNIDEFIQ